MGGPIRNTSAGLGQQLQKGDLRKFHLPMPSVSSVELPVEIIVALKPEMVRNQVLGLSPEIVSLLGDLRERFGMQSVAPLWPIGIPVVIQQPGRPGSFRSSLNPSAKAFLSKSKMLMGRQKLDGRVDISPEEIDETRMRLKLTFLPGSDGEAIVKRIEIEGGVEYAEKIADAECPILPAMNKEQMFPKASTPKPGDPPFFPVKPWAEWARLEIGWIAEWSKLALQNIAVFDSGVDSTHPSLANAIDFANDESKVDPSGHGTFVAGIIAGRATVASKALGLDPDAVSDTMDGLLPASKLWVQNVMNPVAVRTNDNKVTYRVDPGKYSNALNQISKAHANSRGNPRLKKIQVVNLSLGSSRFSKTEQRDIALLLKHGVTVVASVGNYSSNILYPAAFDGVVAVGASAYKGGLWQGTNDVSISARETAIDLLAPGEFILSTMPRTASAMKIPFSGWLSGTSMAAPHVAAVAAVLRSEGMSTACILKLIGNFSNPTGYAQLKCPIR